MMNHTGTKELQTQRLILRKFKIEEYQAMYDNWASEDEVTKYLTWPTHASPEVTKSVLTEWVGNYEKSDFYNWAIELKSEKTIVGNFSVVYVNENAESAILGYCMGSRWWGKEIMKEAGLAVIKYLFTEAGFNRVAACHDKGNPKSGRVMQKMGMTYDGTLRSAAYSNQGIVDEVWYSILKSEYCGA
ncbi:MAG: GNAT family N-acetyltransferase [Spirochaetaceae bacterium]|nr:GNAT family N-acetyltransferase [Spirochaetaceae bacterium]